jgi:hypothetical protein
MAIPQAGHPHLRCVTRGWMVVDMLPTVKEGRVLHHGSERRRKMQRAENDKVAQSVECALMVRTFL